MSASAGGSPVAADRRAMWSAVHLGLSFCGIFMAFNTTQSFQTSSDHKSAGSTALGILYAALTVSNFVSSFLVVALGTKLAMCVGSLTYVAFVASNIHYEMIALYSVSALLGLGASVLWTAQGAYISACSVLHERAHGLPDGSTLGFFNGIFFSIFQVSNVAGSLLAALMFKLDVDVETVFIVMTAICGCGALTLTCIKDPSKEIDAHDGYELPGGSAPPNVMDELTRNVSYLPSDSSDSNLLLDSTTGDDERRSTCRTILSVFESLRLLLVPRMLVLVPIMIYSGLSQTFLFGVMPSLIVDRSTKFFVVATLGGFDAASSIAMGRLSDRYGRLVVLMIGFVASLTSIGSLLFWPVSQSSTWVFFLLGAGLGISDGVFNTLIYTILGSWFPGRVEQAIANFKLMQAGATAIAFLVNDHMSLHAKCIMTIAPLVAGMACILAYHTWHKQNGGGNVLDQSPSTDADSTADSLSSPILPSVGAHSHLSSVSVSAYASPVLQGHTSLNRKETADSIMLDSQVAYPTPTEL